MLKVRDKLSIIHNEEIALVPEVLNGSFVLDILNLLVPLMQSPDLLLFLCYFLLLPQKDLP